MVHRAAAHVRSKAARARTCSSTTAATSRSSLHEKHPELFEARRIGGLSEETTTGVHRLYEMDKKGTLKVAGDQRQRLGHQEQVRQPLRLPRVAARRHQARDRRDVRGQGRGRRGLRRRRQGLRAGAPRPGRARAHHRDRSDLRAAGGDGGLSGRRRWTTPLRWATSSSPRPGCCDVITRRAHEGDEERGHPLQHRSLRFARSR